MFCKFRLYFSIWLSDHDEISRFINVANWNTITFDKIIKQAEVKIIFRFVLGNSLYMSFN